MRHAVCTGVRPMNMAFTRRLRPGGQLGGYIMNRAVQGITDFIFMSDIPQKSDVILVPGTAHAQITEKAAQLYHQGYAPYILPSGR